MAFGVTPTGFVPKTIDVIKTELETDLKTTFGAILDTSPNEPFGLFVGLASGWFADLWDMAEAVYQSAYPDSATDSSLDDICTLTGTQRPQPLASKVSVVLWGTNGTVVASGKQIKKTTTSIVFGLDTGATIVTLPAWAISTVFALGALVQNGGSIYEQVALTGGTSAGGGGGPVGTGLAFADNTCLWRFIAVGTAAVLTGSSALVVGAQGAPAGTITTIVTPVSGWTGVSNALDAAIGRDPVLDPALRVLREEELQASGKATVNSIRAALLDSVRVPGVGNAQVFENFLDIYDLNGLPPHSIECVVFGGLDVDIASAIFDEAGGGIDLFGSTSLVVIDSTGTPQVVKFSRPTLKSIWIIVNLTKLTVFPTIVYGGNAAVQQALVDFSLGRYPDLGPGYQLGDDVIVSHLYAAIYKVAGINDITSILVGFANPPTLGVNLVIGARELAQFDTVRITVNAT